MVLKQGETVDLGTRTGEGLTIQRDESVEDAYQIDNHGGELSRDEIKRLAELAGFEVSEE
ncbi:hypothetical protein HLRTI_000499 [Halorhabdus tiamatea SARL4B]|uniref:Uncharacterized protein n=1 Tax=Halorhabdus tiamatea SARL4B TaxID=1033806 RepID=F7PLQ6_9EURY|nr:hypothetical protein [Halorhabdus tiamatea]ERJ07457.1 hypothetical protein HLRTI_000499 [Halorhabdus tiamatea SARL4B]